MIGLNFADAELAERTANVELCVLVDTLGIVREVRVVGRASPFDSALMDAVRWWWFEPARRGGRPVPARTRLSLAVQPPTDADPLVPDVLEMAREAEARGDARGAIDAWTGALARAGTHPAIGNEWGIRERIVRLASTLREPLAAPSESESRARGAHGRMLRDISRGTNADLAGVLDGVLRSAPWYADAYRWRASARAASGQRAGAIRDVLCYRLATRDSLGRAVADRALVELAVGDTLAALTRLKN